MVSTVICSTSITFNMYNVDAASKQDVWLVKVPKYIANSWKSAPSRAELGKLRVPKDSKGPIKFILDPKLQQLQQSGLNTQSTPQSKLPSEHNLTLTPLVQQRMAILAQTRDQTTTSASNNEAPKISFEGDVKFRGELRSTGDLSYMSLKASSIKEAAKPVRVTQILDKAVMAYKPRGKAQLEHEADLRRRKEEAKRVVREDKEIVQGRLFSAFEKQQYYNIKDLVRITNQSIPYLKEILKEICNHCSKGTNKNMWELKPEYRHYKSASGSGK